MITLSPIEISTAQQLLANYAPAQETLAILLANNGDFADCLDRRRRKLDIFCDHIKTTENQ
jgi:hypothetical protein